MAWSLGWRFGGGVYTKNTKDGELEISVYIPEGCTSIEGVGINFRYSSSGGGPFRTPHLLYCISGGGNNTVVRKINMSSFNEESKVTERPMRTDELAKLYELFSSEMSDFGETGFSVKNVFNFMFNRKEFNEAKGMQRSIAEGMTGIFGRYAKAAEGAVIEGEVEYPSTSPRLAIRKAQSRPFSEGKH